MASDPAPIPPQLSASSHWLTDDERDEVMRGVAAEGFAVLPRTLSPEDCTALGAATLAVAEGVRAKRAPTAPRSVKVSAR
jgi:hypothetical protein